MGLIPKKAGGFNIMDAFLVAGSKIATEQILKPIVGNSNYMSGATKIALGYLVPKVYNNKITKTMATGLVIDGTEDIMYKLIGGVFGGGNSNGGGSTI